MISDDKTTARTVQSAPDPSVPFREKPRTELQNALDRHFADLAAPKILEAGCGSGSNVKLPANVVITGIDISAEELEQNEIVTTKIVGDIQTYDLGSEVYDLIVCWDVLEHLPRPEDAMKRFVHALRQGGLLLVAVPNVYSIKGLIAKFTPHWFHHGVYRWIYGAKFGTKGVNPFPTFLRWSIAPDRIVEFAEKNGLQIEIESVHESGVQRRFRKKIPLGQMGWNCIEGAVRVLSFGRLTWAGSDCLFLLRKRRQPGNVPL